MLLKENAKIIGMTLMRGYPYFLADYLICKQSLFSKYSIVARSM